MHTLSTLALSRVAGLAVSAVASSCKTHNTTHRLRAQAMSTSAGLGAPSASKVKVALCQILTTADKQENLQTARNAIQEAASNGANLVVLPEMWNCPYSNDSFPSFAEDIRAGDSPSTLMLAEAAARHKITLVGGSIPERCDGRLYNTCSVFSPEGTLLATYRKTHLFDIDIPGKITFKESLTLTPGEGITIVETPAGHIGLGICYDIRFPELAALYKARGAQLLIYPGAFNMTTGPLHWELLQKARAVDNQLFVATCSPARNLDSSYHAWGHSTVVGPFAEILGTTDHEPAIVYAELDYEQVAQRRLNMPLDKQRRYDLYTQLDKTAP